MLEWIQNTSDDLNWIVILSSLLINAFFILDAIFRLRKWVRQKRLRKLTKRADGRLALSVGFGSNNPIEKVKQFSERYPDLVILPPIQRTHAKDVNAFLNEKEIVEGLEDVKAQVGQLRRISPKEVLVFYAGPLAAALQIGYFFRNFPCLVRFMQLNQATKEYEVLATPV